MPAAAKHFRGRCVALAPDGVMDWHSTRDREEVLMVLEGVVIVEIQRARRTRVRLAPSSCLFLPQHTAHRVINRTSVAARYLYLTAG